MDPQTLITIKELLVPMASAFTLVSVGISSWLALRQYRLKLKSEQVENDIKLVKTFCELLYLAHARTEGMYSEYIDKLFEKDIISKADFQQLNLRQKIETTGFATPVGLASQEAAIAAIATLGLRHDMLTDASLQALASLAVAIQPPSDEQAILKRQQELISTR